MYGDERTSDSHDQDADSDDSDDDLVLFGDDKMYGGAGDDLMFGSFGDDFMMMVVMMMVTGDDGG